jgi:acyl carrier protein
MISSQLQRNQKKEDFDMLSMPEFIDVIKVEVLQLPESSILDGNTRYKELPEWNSLSGLSLLFLSDSLMNIKLSAVDIRDTETIAELYQVIISKG